MGEQLLKVILLILTIALFGLSCGCANLPITNPNQLAQETFKKDLKLNIDGVKFKGIAVLPRKSVYKIKIQPESSIERLIIQTCHRDATIDKPKTGWLSSEIEYIFSPQVGLEDSRSCPLEIAALDINHRKNGFAYVDWIDARPHISLSARMRCNGEFSIPQGTGICQSAVGLIQEVFFNQQVIVAGYDSRCAAPETKDGFFWQWKMSQDKCVYYFVAREKHENGERIAFRLNAIGFTAVPVRD